MTVVAVMFAVVLLAGCNDDDACHELVQELCESERQRAPARQGDRFSCEPVEDWLAGIMAETEGERRRLTPDQREVACRAIRKNPEVLERYRDELRRALPAP